MGTRRRHTPEQIIRKLTEAERLLDEGRTLELPRFGGHLMIRGVSPLKGVHDGKNEAAVSAGVSV